jgi:hypothetical protein
LVIVSKILRISPAEKRKHCEMAFWGTELEEGGRGWWRGFDRGNRVFTDWKACATTPWPFSQMFFIKKTGPWGGPVLFSVSVTRS